MRLLAYLAKQSLDRSEPCTSIKKMAYDLGISEGRVRFARKTLESKGLIVSKARFREDGGQLACAYTVTPFGRETLKRHFEKAPQCRN